MSLPFKIIDLIEQTADSTTSRAVSPDGSPLLLTRIVLDPSLASKFQDPNAFTLCLDQLRAIKHPALRVVIDAGLDPATPSIWISNRWIIGKPLTARHIAAPEIRSLGQDLKSLLEAISPHGGALNFRPEQILSARTDDGKLHALFSIDYHRWFHDWALGLTPGQDRNPAAEVRKLLETLTIKQLRLPKTDPNPPIPTIGEQPAILAELTIPPEPRLARILFWLALLAGLLTIAYFTYLGSQN